MNRLERVLGSVALASLLTGVVIKYTMNEDKEDVQYIQSGLLMTFGASSAGYIMSLMGRYKHRKKE